MKKRIIAMMFSLILVFPTAGLASELVLVKGKGVEVCEAYKKNLNSFNLHNWFVMVCEREINPTFTDFKKPEWEELDLWEDREFLRKVEKFLGLEYDFGDPDRDIQRWERMLKERITSMYATTIDASQIDINNDGKKENVIKYRHGYCPGGNYYGAALLILNDDEDEIDIEKTKPLLQNPARLENQPLSAGWDGAMYDVFIYKKRVYFDRWRWSDKLEKEPSKFLKVFVTEPNKAGYSKTREICRLQFRATK